MRSLADCIKVYENVVPLELCDAIIAEYEAATDWVPARVKATQELDASERDVDTILMTNPHNTFQRAELDKAVFQCAETALKLYIAEHPTLAVEKDSGYELLRYKTGQAYKPHVDAFKEAPRIVSCSFQLNDGYEGGEWGFFDNQYLVTPPKGAVVMFPSNFVFPHQINTVTAGTRYSIVTWFL